MFCIQIGVHFILIKDRKSQSEFILFLHLFMLIIFYSIFAF